jgi:hypothetical protein
MNNDIKQASLRAAEVAIARVPGGKQELRDELAAIMPQGETRESRREARVYRAWRRRAWRLAVGAGFARKENGR